MDFHNKKKKKKRITKAKLVKGLRGSISILLCLLLTPFMSIALGLVEYSRYQEVLEITDEIYELTGVSLLSDYDKYIHNRFGLLATSQDGELDEGADAILTHNMKVLGKQVTLENPSFTGKLSLANTGVLRQQVLDFSELTSTTAVLAEDLKLEELLNKIQNVSQFQEVMNTVDSLADLADALKVAVEKLEALETAVGTLETTINNTVTSANNLSTEMSDLFKKLGENGITLPENATLEEIESAVSSFTDSYLSDFKNLYKTANTLITNLKSIKSNLTSVKSAADEFVGAVQSAKTAIENVSSPSSSDQDGAVTKAATSTFEEVLEEMEKLVEGTVSELTNDVVNTAKSTVDTIINTTIESIGLAGVIDRYNEIVNGDYFSLPLTDTAKQDITDLLKTVQTVYSSNSGDALTDYFRQKLIPDIKSIESIVAGLKSQIPNIISQATSKLTEEMKDKVISLLTDLVNIVKGLFDLDVFSDPDLNATINIGADSSSPYQAFLDALDAISQSVEDFTSSSMDFDILGALDAMGDMFTAIGNLLQSIFDIAGAAVESIVELSGSLVSGDVRGLYEKFLISGYMRHNLPSRINYNKTLSYDADGNKISTVLDGSGLTNFSYNDIPRSGIILGDGFDTMFKGAELEYIRAGTCSETANQTICFFDLFFLRLLLDLPSVFMNSEVRSTAIAANVASWVVYILYVVAEPFLDTVLLVNGKNVPLLRGSECWLTVSGIDGLVSRLADVTLGEELKSFVSSHGESGDGDDEESDEEGLNYQTHMLILLLVYVDSDTQISRFQDLIELETSEYYRQNGKAFSMNKTYTAIEIKADATFNPFFDLGTFTGGGSLLPSFEIKQIVSY